MTSCNVTYGTAIFVAATSVECSTFEGNGTTEPQMKTCARQSVVKFAPTITIDGAQVKVSKAETGLLNIVLPSGNLFGLPDTSGYSYGHGWDPHLVPRLIGYPYDRHQWVPRDHDGYQCSTRLVNTRALIVRQSLST